MTQGNGGGGGSGSKADNLVLDFSKIAVSVGLQCNKRVGIGDIGHITHREGAAVAVGKALRTSPEGHGQRVGGSIHFGKGNQVGGGAVESERVVAAVGIGGAAVFGSSAGTNLSPAVGQVTAQVVKVLSVGQCDGLAQCGEGNWR